MTDHPKIQFSDGILHLNFGEYGQQVELAAFSSDGRRLLTVHNVDCAEIWDTASGQKVGEIRPESPLRGAKDVGPSTRLFQVFIEACALNPDGSRALLGLNDGTAGIFRVADGTRLAWLYPPDAPPATEWDVIRAVAYSRDGALALVGFPKRRVGVWSSDGDRCVAFLEHPDGGKLVGEQFVRDTLISSVGISDDNRWVFAGSVDMTAIVWNLETTAVAWKAMEHAERLVALFDTDEGFGWATTGGSVWQSHAGEPVRKTIASGEHWASVAFGSGAFLSKRSDGAVTEWTLSGERIPCFQPSAGAKRGLQLSAPLAYLNDGSSIIPEGENRLTIRAGKQTTTIEFPTRIVSAQLSQRRDLVALTGWNDVVEVRAIPGGRLVQSFKPAGGAGCIAFSPDGSLLAIGESGKGGGLYTRNVFIHETASGRLIQTYSEHQWQISWVAFSPDGRWVASMGDELMLSEVESVSGRAPRTIARLSVDRAVKGAQFLSDGRLLVIDRGRARILLQEQQLLEMEVPVDFDARWCVSGDERTLNVELRHGVARFDLTQGTCIGVWEAPITRPKGLPSSTLAEALEPRSGCAVWRTDWGVFIHQSDGPRGWVQPLRLSAGNEVVLPTRDGAAVVRVDPEELLGVVPFEGTLRAGTVVGNEVLLVNETGRLFRSPRPRASA